jgi:hypothetical protein
MALEDSVARHYTQRSLEQAILGALAASGVDNLNRGVITPTEIISRAIRSTPDRQRRPCRRIK